MKAGKTNDSQNSLESLKAKASELLAIDRHHLLMKMPFIGSLIMRLELVPVLDCRLDTAATDGDNIYVDIEFYSKLNPEERQFVIAHEAWHCALLHFARRQNRDHQLFNCAADLEIHFILTREGLKAPFVLPHNPEWNGLSAEEIYTLLPSWKNDNGQESKNIRNVRGEGGFDRHLDNDNKNNDVIVNNGKGIDPDYLPGIKPGAAERCRERLTSAVQQYERTHGTLPDGVNMIVKKVLEPKINWRELLSQFVTSCYGGSRQWLPPSRRHVWQGLYMQSSRESRLNAVVAVDTSGSTVEELPCFFGELGGLLNSFGSYQLTVIQCDAEVQKVDVFDDMTPLLPDYEWFAKGGGGTDFRPVFDYVEEKLKLTPNLLIYLTDGFGSYPEHAPAYPMLWMVTSGGQISVPWGMQCPFEIDKEN
ncbi:MAG: hypothetical protein IJS08_15620 [Victivallales bacterium]|nr:hypothetical protein [Victivallales bacterium]